MTFTSTDPANHKGKSDIWLTPLTLIKSFGEFDLDPCGFYNHPTAKHVFLEDYDGLSNKWFGRVWLNPPYSNVNCWLDKAYDEYLNKRISSCIALVFARTDAKWAQKHLRIWDEVLFLNGRIKFINSKSMKAQTTAGTPSMILFLGESNNNYLNGVTR